MTKEEKLELRFQVTTLPLKLRASEEGHMFMKGDIHRDKVPTTGRMIAIVPLFIRCITRKRHI